MTVQMIDLKTLQIDADTLRALDSIAEWQATSRVQVVQWLLRQGARDAQLAHAASLYTRGEVTLERAAELAETSIYDMMAYLRTHNVAVPANWSDLDLDVVQMLRRVGRMDIAQRFLHETRAPSS